MIVPRPLYPPLIALLRGLLTALLIALTACTNPSPTVTAVTVTPSGATMLSGSSQSVSSEVAGTLEFDRTVNWTASAGTLLSTQGKTNTFTAPVVQTATIVTLTAVSVGNPAVSGTTTITVNPVPPPPVNPVPPTPPPVNPVPPTPPPVNPVPPTPATLTAVTVSAASSTLDAAATTALNATVTGTGAFGTGVNWSIVSGGGALSATTGASVTFTAPSLNASSVTVIRAASVQDPSKSATVKLGINPSPTVSAVTVTASRVALRESDSTTLTADVTGTGNFNPGVTWSLDPDAVGTLSSTTGNTATYQAPKSSTGRIVRVTATSAQDVSVKRTILVSVNPRQSSMSGGPAHSLALKNDGTLLAWGNNLDGQLGDGTTTNSSTPVAVSSANNIVAVAAGAFHSLALKSDGTLLAWGYNGHGSLGDGTFTSSSKPVAVISASNIVAISAFGHSVALKSDGTVLTWGFNQHGQLGDGTTTNRSTPSVVSSINNVVAIAAGSTHTLVLKSDGTLLSWGTNGFGQLGDGNIPGRFTPGPVSNVTDIVAIAAGRGHSLAIRSDGTLLSWGSNSSGQLGDGTNVSRSTPVTVFNASNIIAIAVGGFHSLALRSDGTLLTWGSNTDGELGNGSRINSSTFIPVAVSSASKIVAIGAGQTYSVALKGDGTLLSWGTNPLGQLGDGTVTSRSTPVSVLIESLTIRLP